MIKKNSVIGIVFVIVEIFACAASFFLLTDFCHYIGFPFTESMFFGIVQLSVLYTLTAIALLILLVALNQRITGEFFTYKAAVPSMILGAIMSFLVLGGIQDYTAIDFESSQLFTTALIYGIPIMILNIGIRIKKPTQKKPR